MSKIPVGDTISGAYSFTFSNILSIFGIMWFPYLILIALIVGLVMLTIPELPRMIAQHQFDPMVVVRLARIAGLIWLAAIIVSAMVTVGMQRKALGLHPAPVFFYFSLGAPVWRMVGALFFASLVIVLIGAVTAGLTVAIWFAAGSYVPAYATLIRVVAIVAAVLWFFYMMVRLVFFLPAVVVAEERIGLGRSWELGGGNFWRIVVVWIAVFLPIVIAFSIVSNVIFGSMFDMSRFTHQMTPEELMRVILPQMFAMGPFIIVLQLVERAVLTGLGNGAIATAYRSVVPKPDTIAPAADGHA